jgi:transposase
MSNSYPLTIQVSVDIGSVNHNVAVGLSTGELLEEFAIAHKPDGFRQFFSKIEAHEHRYQCEVKVAMEGYNGYARPLDSMVRARSWRLFNVNNLKLARFKEIFPGAAKTDALDARKGLELFQLQEHLALAKDVLQEVGAIPHENAVLKRFSRRRRQLVREKTRIMNRLQSDLQAVCPGILEMTVEVGNKWFLRFITSTKQLVQLAKLRRSTLLKIRGIGKKWANVIQEWQKKAYFSTEAEYAGDMIQEDARRILELEEKIEALEGKITAIIPQSTIAKLIDSIPGFGQVCSSELAGEVGTIDRFGKESSLALYIGMANLDNSSGRYRGSKAPKHVNTYAKAAMMIAVDKHRKKVAASQQYYERKRAEGKKHNQAIRALGRHLCRVIFKMLKNERYYELRES